MELGTSGLMSLSQKAIRFNCTNRFYGVFWLDEINMNCHHFKEMREGSFGLHRTNKVIQV